MAMDVSDSVPPESVSAEALNERELRAMYDGFITQSLSPLWTQIDNLMPAVPHSAARPHLWHWDELLPLARRAGDLVPVGRGGERRAIALANPGLRGAPFATPTLWAAIQYLGPREEAPSHRHSQHAFRFVIEGEGVWTLVNGDPVAMRRGDFLPQAGWGWHAHLNRSDEPMAWLDGLDIPFAHYIESTFFESGDIRPGDFGMPARSRSERLWGHPGLAPISVEARPQTNPLLVYRWEDTDRALNDQLALEDEGQPGTVEPGHAAVRYVDPSTGRDVLRTIRAEFHRLRAAAVTGVRREAGSSVYQVFDGGGTVTVGKYVWSVRRGDVFVVPSWEPLTVEAAATSSSLDLFRFSDAPILEALTSSRPPSDRESRS